MDEREKENSQRKLFNVYSIEVTFMAEQPQLEKGGGNRGFKKITVGVMNVSL